jgi:hypothetical protein
MKKLIMSALILVGLVGFSFASTMDGEKLNFSSLVGGCGTGGTVIIKGTVRDHMTYAKLGGTTVQLLSDTKVLCQTVTTVATGVYTGNYAFAGVTGPNNYYVKVSRSGYYTQEKLVNAPAPFCCGPTEITVHILLDPM